MAELQITNLTFHEGGFHTALVTVVGSVPVRVDDRLGSWTFTTDQSADPASRAVRRREVIPTVAAHLQRRVLGHGQEADLIVVERTLRPVRFEPARDVPTIVPTNMSTNVSPPPAPKSYAQQLAERMARAGKTALEAA